MTIDCPFPFSSFTISDNGSGFLLSALLKVGFAPYSSRKTAPNAGNGLFWLSKNAHIKIASRTHLSRSSKVKYLSFDNIGMVKDEMEDDTSIGSVVEVTNLFKNSPVRARYLQANSALQRRSISKLLLEKSACYPYVTFSWFVDDSKTTFEAVKGTSFDRLSSIFSQFNSALLWLSIDFSYRSYHIHGYILSPCTQNTSIHLTSTNRLLFFNHHRVSCPELFGVIDACWLQTLSYSSATFKAKSKCSVFFIDVEGQGDTFEVLRSLDSTSSVLRLHDSKTFLKLFKEYLQSLMPPSTPINCTGDPQTSPEISRNPLVAKSEMFSTVCSLSPVNSSIEPTSADVLELWHSRKEFRSFERFCEFPRLQSTESSVDDITVLSRLIVVGQADLKFIIALDPSNGSLIALDQHAVRHNSEHFILNYQCSNPFSTVFSLINSLLSY